MIASFEKNLKPLKLLTATIGDKKSRCGKKALLLLVLCVAIIAVVVVMGSPKKALAQSCEIVGCNPGFTCVIDTCQQNNPNSSTEGCLTTGCLAGYTCDTSSNTCQLNASVNPTDPTQPPATAPVASASNQKVSWYDCAPVVGSPVTCAIYFTTLAVNAVMNLLIALGAMLVRNILSLDRNLLDLAAVQTGFAYSLGIANLGFVLGIIVIALATILRSQTYGIKQILWKLVVAAIVVNFGLVISGVILKFSDTLTQSFLKPMGGEGGFVNELTDALGASKLETPPLAENTILKGVASGVAGGVGKVVKCAGIKFIFLGAVNCDNASGGAAESNKAGENSLLKDLDNFMKAVLALVFAIIFKFIVAFTLLALAILLLIRFVYISVLLVLLPLAWLMWVFPKFSHLNSKWWHNFLRWVFFPPIAVFFLYLAIMTSRSPLKLAPIAKSPVGTPEAGLGIMTNTSGLIGAAADSIVIVALALGSLFAANSFGIHGANVAMGAMKSIGTAAQGYVGKKGKMAAARVVPSRVKEKLEKGEYRLAPKRVQSWMGRGLGAVEKAGGGKLVEEQAAWARAHSKDPKEGARLLAGSLETNQELALLKQMAAQGDLGEVKTVNGRSFDEYLQNEKYFTNAGQGQLHDDVNKSIGSTVQSRQAAKEQAAELTKEQPKIDIIDNDIASLDEKSKKIESAEKNARRALAANPNAILTDTDGIVTGSAGTKMNAKDFVDSATKRFVAIEELKKKAEGMKAKIIDEANAKATMKDTKGTLGAPGATVNAKELHDKELENLIGRMTSSEAAKVAGNAIYGKGDRLGLSSQAADSLGESFARAIATRAPQFISPIIRKMKSEPLQKFSDVYMRILGALEKQASGNQQLADHFKKLQKNFSRSINYNIVGGMDWEVEGEGKETADAGGAAAATPPPPPPSGGKSTT